MAQQAPEPSVCDDPERFRALASCTQPWPLRDHLPKPAPTMFVMPRPGCEPGEGLPVVVRQPVLEHGRPPAVQETRLRLPGFTYVNPAFPSAPGDGNRLHQRLRAMPEAAFCRGPAPADWADAPRIESAFLEINPLPFGDGLDPRCHRPGLPGDPRPECDRPHDSRWWIAFALGLPVDMRISGPHWRVPEGAPLGRMAAVWALPGRTLEPRPADGWTLRDAEGRARAVVLPRLGGDEDTREPLMPDCLMPGTAIGGGWRPPGTAEEARLPRAWTLCEVAYRHRGLLTVRYRFEREVFDEPDIPLLDLRVRRLVQRMLDGADALPPPTDAR